MEQYGPGRPAGATSQPWGLYHVGSEGQQTSPHASQPISPTPPQEKEFFFREKEV